MSNQSEAGGPPQENSVPTEQSQDKVSYDTYRKVLNEAKKTKELLKQLESEKQQLSENKLKEQNEYKTLWEQTQSRLAETEKVLSEKEQTVIKTTKYQAFERYLGGRLRDQSYDVFVPYDNIVFDPETQKINDDSVKMAVSDFVKKHGHLVEFQSNKLPSDAANSFAQSGVKTPDRMSKEEIEKELLKRFS